jgi:hypothetical protein
MSHRQGDWNDSSSDEVDHDDRSVRSHNDSRKSTSFRDGGDDSPPEFSAGSFSKRRTKKLLVCMSGHIDDIKKSESRRIPSKLDQFVMSVKTPQDMVLKFSSDMAKKICNYGRISSV